jgi:hypothetical protein
MVLFQRMLLTLQRSNTLPLHIGAGLPSQDKKDYVLKRVRLAKQTKWQRNSTLQERDLVRSVDHAAAANTVAVIA